MNRCRIRARRLWGRERELSLFRTALAGPSAPFSVRYVHGLGGVGKSALLGACANEAARAGILTVSLDGRNIEPSPGELLHALGHALGLGDGESPLDRLRREATVVVTFDSYDSLAPLDPWLRQTFLPELPARGVVLIAGRMPPPAAWTTDPALNAILRVLPLRNLSPADSRALLLARHVPEEQHTAVLRFTHGHPLALVLLGEVVANGGSTWLFRPENAPGVVRELLGRLVATAPTVGHRKALETCARARVTTEALLAAVVGEPGAHETFEWLRGLSFIEQGPEGLFPHDIVREVLVTYFSSPV